MKEKNRMNRSKILSQITTWKMKKKKIWIVDTFASWKREKNKKEIDKMTKNLQSLYYKTQKVKWAKQQYNEYWILFECKEEKNININNLNFFVITNILFYWLPIFNIHLIGVAFFIDICYLLHFNLNYFDKLIKNNWICDWSFTQRLKEE